MDTRRTMRQKSPTTLLAATTRTHIVILAIATVFALAFGIGLGLADSRYGILTGWPTRASIAATAFLRLDEMPNPSRCAGALFAIDDCACRRVGGRCSCGSLHSTNGPETAVLATLETMAPPLRTGPSTGFHETLLSATGYARIRPDKENPVVDGRKASHLGGELREYFLMYDSPFVSVRTLALLHTAKTPRSLFIHTPASWTIAETPLGISDPMYLRNVGVDLFNAGHDVLAFDHGPTVL